MLIAIAGVIVAAVFRLAAITRVLSRIPARSGNALGAKWRLTAPASGRSTRDHPTIGGGQYFVPMQLERWRARSILRARRMLFELFSGTTSLRSLCARVLTASSTARAIRFSRAKLPHFTRVSTAIQFVSQVLPPSSENACSKRHEFAVMSDHTLRTRIIRPLNGS